MVRINFWVNLTQDEYVELYTNIMRENKYKEIILLRFVNKPWKHFFFQKINIWYVKSIYILFIYLRIYVLGHYFYVILLIHSNFYVILLIHANFLE